jgi:hypothetical protein
VTPAGNFAFIMAGFSPDETGAFWGYPVLASGRWEFIWHLRDLATHSALRSGTRGWESLPEWSARMEGNKVYDFYWGPEDTYDTYRLMSESSLFDRAGDPRFPDAPESCEYTMASP